MNKVFIRFIIRFAFAFGLCYLGALAIIGLSSPGGLYSPFVARYLDIISWLRSLLLAGTRLFLHAIDVDTYYVNRFVIRKVGGNGIRMVYTCIGYGVMSFWVALVFANEGGIKKMLGWGLAGLVVICLINIARLSMVLLSANGVFNFPWFDHHTWFNLFSYLLIFMLLYFYNRSHKSKPDAH